MRSGRRRHPRGEDADGWFEVSLAINCVADFDGRFTRVNRLFLQALGYSAEDLLSRPFLEFVHSDDREVATAEVKNLIQDLGGTVEFTNRFRAKDGSYRWLQWSATASSAERSIYASARDVTEVRLLEEELRLEAQTDPLTELPNRRRFEDVAERQLEYIERYGTGGAMLMLDLDGLKETNDLLGHEVGDELLLGVAKALRGRLRGTDAVARIGGDEFAVLLPEATPVEAGEIAGSLVDAIGRAAAEVAGKDARPSVSIGVAVFRKGVASEVSDLLRMADEAMYRAKAAGGGRYELVEVSTVRLPEPPEPAGGPA